MAMAELQGEPKRVRVADVSEHGARLSGIGPVGLGTRCTLRVLGDMLAARVRWSDGDRAGIAFDAPLTRRQFDTLREAASTRRRGRAPRRTFAFAEMR